MPVNDRALLGQKMLQALCETLALDPSNVQRIVIDCEVHDVVHVYVQQIGRESLLKFDWGQFITGESIVTTEPDDNDRD